MAKRIREKTEKIAATKDTRPCAHANYIRISPFKVRPVLDIVRGKSVNEALAILAVTPKAASEILLKLINSAVANAEAILAAASHAENPALGQYTSAAYVEFEAALATLKSEATQGASAFYYGFCGICNKRLPSGFNSNNSIRNKFGSIRCREYKSRNFVR